MPSCKLIIDALAETDLTRQSKRAVIQDVLIAEALSPADVERIEGIVRRLTREGELDQRIVKLVKNNLVQLFRQLYTKRSVWRDGITSNMEQ